jgi:hypothetical protein
MPFLELFDETLDINSSENYAMTVQVSQDGVAFCILDTIRNKFILLRSFEPDNGKYFNQDMIRDILIKDDFLTRKYRRVKVVMPAQKFTVVPAQLYDPGKKDEYFSFNHIQGEGNTILSNRVSDPDSYLLFQVQKSLADIIDSYYPDYLVLHQIKPLLNHIAHNRKSVTGNYIHLHTEREFFNLIIFDQNIMKLCNAYKYRNTTDIMYFTLNALRTLGIGQEETIHLSGNTEKFDSLYSSLSMYIRDLKYSVPAGNFTFSYVFDDSSRHRFLNLFTSINCE